MRSLILRFTRISLTLPLLLETSLSFVIVPAAKVAHRTNQALFLSSDNNVVDLTNSNHQQLFGSDVPLLIDAYAPWCGPCKLLEPVVEECARSWDDRLAVSRLNVESGASEVMVELLFQDAMPNKLPTLILVNKGSAKVLHSGIISNEELDELLLAELGGDKDTSTLEENSTLLKSEIGKQANVNNSGAMGSKVRSQPVAVREADPTRNEAGRISLVQNDTEDYMLNSL